MEAEHVIHVPVPDFRNGDRRGNEEALATAYRGALTLADRRGLRSLVVPLSASDPRTGPLQLRDLRAIARAAFEGILTASVDDVYLVEVETGAGGQSEDTAPGHDGDPNGPGHPQSPPGPGPGPQRPGSPRRPVTYNFPPSAPPPGSAGAHDALGGHDPPGERDEYLSADELVEDLNASVVSGAGGSQDYPLLGPDLFGLREPSPAPPFLAGRDYSGLAPGQSLGFLSALNMGIPGPPPREQLDPATLPDEPGSAIPVERTDDELTRWAPPDNLPPLPKRTAMPRIVHSIWLGGPLRKAGSMARFRDNIAAAASRHRDYTFMLWTDVPRTTLEAARRARPPVDGSPDPLADVRDMLTWANRNGVKLISVDEVFNAESPLQLGEIYRTEMIKRAGVGYAAASDILRMEIIHRFGGVYTDPDNAVIDLSDVEAIIKSPRGYAVNKDSGYRATISALVMPKGHPFAQLYLDHIRQAYGKSHADLFPAEDAQSPVWDSPGMRAHRHSVVRRTGRGLLMQVARELGYESLMQLPFVRKIKDTSAASWVKPDWQPAPSSRDRAATLELTQNVVQALVRDLYSRGGGLRLTLVEEAVARHPDPDLVWAAALSLIASRPELASRVTHVIDRRVLAGEEQLVRWPESARSLLSITEDGREYWFGEYRYPATIGPRELGPLP
jgi:mannosyltransferase OCH1-like enzyme